MTELTSCDVLLAGAAMWAGWRVTGLGLAAIAGWWRSRRAGPDYWTGYHARMFDRRRTDEFR